MLNSVGRFSSVSTTNVCRRDGDVEYSNCERYKSQEDMMRRPLIIVTVAGRILLW